MDGNAALHTGAYIQECVLLSIWTQSLVAIVYYSLLACLVSSPPVGWVLLLANN